MPTLPELVGKRIASDVELRQLLESGVGNVSAIAASLQRSIESELGRSCSRSAIGMAIRRRVSSKKRRAPQLRGFPKHIEISSRTGIYEVAIPCNEKGREAADKVRRSLQLSKGDILFVAEGNYEIAIKTSRQHKAQLTKALGRIRATSELDNLACVTVNWPSSTKSIPGIYYRVTRALAMREISIQSFHTVGAEMMIFVKDDVLDHTYAAISQMLRDEKM